MGVHAELAQTPGVVDDGLEAPSCGDQPARHELGVSDHRRVASVPRLGRPRNRHHDRFRHRSPDAPRILTVAQVVAGGLTVWIKRLRARSCACRSGVDVITDTGPVGRVVLIAEHFDVVALPVAACKISGRGRSRAHAARQRRRVCARSVEVPQTHGLRRRRGHSHRASARPST